MYAAFKAERIGSLIKLPDVLCVKRAFCEQLTIHVPSWTAADRFLQQGLNIRIDDLYIEVQSKLEYAADNEDRSHKPRSSINLGSASLEADPLGSIASWYQLSNIISERMEVSAKTIRVHLIVHGRESLKISLTEFYARTSNSLWQDLKDLTSCIDRSPDGLLKTRFKFISFTCGIFIMEPMQLGDSEAPSQANCAWLCPLDEHPVIIRHTIYEHRASKQKSWTVLSDVYDIIMDSTSCELKLSELSGIYSTFFVLFSWFDQLRIEKHSDFDVQEAAAAPDYGVGGCSGEPGESASKIAPEVGDALAHNASTFRHQITIRGSLSLNLSFQLDFLEAQTMKWTIDRASVNYILYLDGSSEVQLTFNEMAIDYEGLERVFTCKPDCDVLSFRKTRQKWIIQCSIQQVKCCIRNKFARALNRLYHSSQEKEQAASIVCKVCGCKIPLEVIDAHICQPLNSSERSVKKESTDSTAFPQLHLILGINELEIQLDNFAFSSIYQLIYQDHELERDPTRLFSINASGCTINTEMKEFSGEALFVPILPLAFQMLECVIAGCNCHEPSKDPRITNNTILACIPDNVFADMRNFIFQSQDLSSGLDTYFEVDNMSLRGSFSSGETVCINCRPQLILQITTDRVRMQLDPEAFQFMKKECSEDIWSKCWLTFLPEIGKEAASIVNTVMFMAVLRFRVMEYTLLQPGSRTASQDGRLKTQFRQVEMVADNQQGYLALQWNTQMRSLFQTTACESRSERRVIIESISARLLKRRNRQHAAAKTIQNAWNLRKMHSPTSWRTNSYQRNESECTATETNKQAKKSEMSPSRVATELFDSTASRFEDFAASLNSKNVVGELRRFGNRASVLKVEMTGMAKQGKQSAAKMLGTLSPKSATTSLQQFVSRHSSTNADNSLSSDADTRKPIDERHATASVHSAEIDSNDIEEELTVYPSPSDLTVQDTSQSEKLEVEKSEERLQSSSEDIIASLNLPSVLRISIQIDGKRLAIPIRPTRSIQELCDEIVRRYNEMYARRNAVLHVSIQDTTGCTFSSKDLVGVIYSTMSSKDNEIWFAHEHKDALKSYSQVGSRSNTTKDTESRGQQDARNLLKSILPIPLVLALLANDTDENLEAGATHQSQLSGSSVDEWPELVMNASFLSPPNSILKVRVGWMKETLQLDDLDAFMLCFQVLGRHSERKFVGSVLRNRLKVDSVLKSLAYYSDGDIDTNMTITHSDLISSIKETFGVTHEAKS
uniref:Uncharacterized protein AlNc14C5G754 n=1 Tax=Albugo laibachii Nc14 TaxID=890382 RepID=F0W0X4_9STRA|nr:conserved hypothetical protein [Albugo laibachii Nc14]|eukprot:CCA14698.1 conserved hypothetical protein [Albugo laibachii Nc14]